jgi:methyl-accepting chemotaxis protein
MGLLTNGAMNTNGRLKPGEWPACIGIIVGDLEKANAASEGEFLALGEKLQDFHLRTNEISEMSSGMVRKMAGGDITTAVDGLKDICGHVNDMNQISISGRDTLVAIMERFRKIQAPLRSFENIVRKIHVLCNLINIEIARLGNTEAGFGTLVEQVKELSVNIEVKSATMIRDLEEMTAFIHKDIEKITGFEARQKRQAEQIIGKTTKNLTKLTERHVHAAGRLNDIAASWGGISRNIGDVIASLQFQDITRQRIEHVCSALTEVREKVKKVPASPIFLRRLPFIQRIFRRNGNNGLSDCSVELICGFEIIKLQQAQFTNATDEFIAAVSRITESLEAISMLVNQISSYNNDVIGATAGNGGSFLSSLERSLAGLTNSVSEYEGINAELKKSITHVVGTVNTMSGFIRAIEKISNEMKIVALNALIHAARIGENGLALGVLAESIHQLSVDTIEKTSVITENIKSIIGASESLALAPPYPGGQESRQKMTIAETVHAIIEPLRLLDADTVLLSDQIDKNAGVLAADIEQTIGRINMDKRMDEAKASIGNSLENVIGSMKLFVPSYYSKDIERNIDKLNAQYTMQSERTVHGILVSNPLTSPPDVGDVCGPTTERQTAEVIDDNVEFF